MEPLNILHLSILYRVRNLKFATTKILVNFIKKMMFCLIIGIFQFKSFDLLYIQQISPELIYFISISTCGEFQICGEFLYFLPYRLSIYDLDLSLNLISSSFGQVLPI